LNSDVVLRALKDSDTCSSSKKVSNKMQYNVARNSAAFAEVKGPYFGSAFNMQVDEAQSQDFAMSVKGVMLLDSKCFIYLVR
jgi:hypothetical protein